MVVRKKQYLDILDSINKLEQDYSELLSKYTAIEKENKALKKHLEKANSLIEINNKLMETFEENIKGAIQYSKEKAKQESAETQEMIRSIISQEIIG